METTEITIKRILTILFIVTLLFICFNKCGHNRTLISSNESLKKCADSIKIESK